jgi:hypothetical protein
MSTLRFGTLLANRGKALIAGAHSYMSPAVSSALRQSVIDGALIGAAGGALWGGITSRDGFLEGAGRGAVRGAMTGAIGGAAWGLYNSPIGSNFKDQIRTMSDEMKKNRGSGNERAKTKRQLEKEKRAKFDKEFEIEYEQTKREINEARERMDKLREQPLSERLLSEHYRSSQNKIY